MRLQDMVTGRSYQGVGGSPKEASLEWMSDSHTPLAADVEIRKSLKCYIQGSGRRKKTKGVDGGSGTQDCALSGASVFASLNPRPVRRWLNGLQDLFDTLFETLAQQRAAFFQQKHDAFKALFGNEINHTVDTITGDQEDPDIKDK
ncbi:hypothetical protein Tco_0889522 [Tanacetum coccineum]